MPGDPKECRRHALRCIEIANSTKNDDLKRNLQHIAATWINLATDLERSLALIKEHATRNSEDK